MSDHPTTSTTIEVTDEMISAGLDEFASSGLEVAEGQTETFITKVITAVYVRMASVERSK